MSWIKENGGPLVIGAAVVAVILGYIEMRAPGMVDAEMDTRGLVSTQTLQNISDKLDAVDEKVDDLKQLHNRDQQQADDKIERIVDILLEE